eukprot:scaffold19773_cov43-Cyclotella_meneghiniana.AAC.1
MTLKVTLDGEFSDRLALLLFHIIPKHSYPTQHELSPHVRRSLFLLLPPTSDAVILSPAAVTLPPKEEKKEARRKTKAQKKGKAKKKTPKKNIKKTKALKERSRYAALPPEQLLELQEKKRNAQKLRIEEIRQNDPERYEEIKAKGAENKAKSRALKEYVDTASILYPDDPKKIFSKKLIDQHDWKFGELITSLSLGTEITRALKVKSYDGKIDDNLGKPDPEGVNLRLTHECLANFSYLIFKLTGA